MRVSASLLGVGAIVSSIWRPSCFAFVGSSPALTRRGTSLNSRRLQRQTRSATTLAPRTARYERSATPPTVLSRGQTPLCAAGGEGEGSATDDAPTADAVAVPEPSNLPFFLDPSTRGGAVVVPVLSLLLPVGAYFVLTAAGVDGNKAGAWVGVGYTLIGLILWVGSYFFRVATKNMTYAIQLKNYEQAVIEKRFGELEDEEKDALLDELNDQ